VWVRQGLSDLAEFHHAECDDLPFEDNTFDLAWNFCMFERFNPPDIVLGEMARVSRGYVMIMNQNYRNWGTPVHKLYHNLANLEWDHGYVPLMSLEAIEASMRRCGLEVVERGTIDSPPWMDTWDMPMRGFLKSWLGLLGVQWEWRSRPKQVDAPVDEGPATAGLPAGNGVPAPKTAQGRALDLFEWIERNLPEWFARSQTHHYYALGRKVA
jgi:SAM-dependent methyltransferase